MHEVPPGAPKPLSPSQLVWTALGFYAAMLTVALLWSGWMGESLFWASDEGWASDGPLVDLAVGTLAGLIVIALSHQFSQHTQAGRDLARALGDLLGELSIWRCIVLALASGIAEEAFFRGALQPQVGLVAASLIFGLAHFVPRRELIPWTGFSLAAGFLLGWLFESTGNLLAPITAHTLINAVNLRRLSSPDRS